MIRKARVIAIEPDGGAATVALEDMNRCRRCTRRRQACGAGLLLAEQADNAPQFRCLSSLTVRQGEQVLIDIEEQGSGWLWAVFGAYGLPLAGMLLVTAVFSVFTESVFLSSDAPGVEMSASGYLNSVLTPAIIAELIVFVGAVMGLLGGIFTWRHVSSRLTRCAARSLCLQSARIVSVVSPHR